MDRSDNDTKFCHCVDYNYWVRPPPLLQPPPEQPPQAEEQPLPIPKIKLRRWKCKSLVVSLPIQYFNKRESILLKNKTSEENIKNNTSGKNPVNQNVEITPPVNISETNHKKHNISLTNSPELLKRLIPQTNMLNQEKDITENRSIRHMLPVLPPPERHKPKNIKINASTNTEAKHTKDINIQTNFVFIVDEADFNLLQELKSMNIDRSTLLNLAKIEQDRVNENDSVINKNIEVIEIDSDKEDSMIIDEDTLKSIVRHSDQNKAMISQAYNLVTQSIISTIMNTNKTETSDHTKKFMVKLIGRILNEVLPPNSKNSDEAKTAFQNHENITNIINNLAINTKEPNNSTIEENRNNNSDLNNTMPNLYKLPTLQSPIQEIPPATDTGKKKSYNNDSRHSTKQQQNQLFFQTQQIPQYTNRNPTNTENMQIPQCQISPKPYQQWNAYYQKKHSHKASDTRFVDVETGQPLRQHNQSLVNAHTDYSAPYNAKRYEKVLNARKKLNHWSQYQQQKQRRNIYKDVNSQMHQTQAPHSQLRQPNLNMHQETQVTQMQYQPFQSHASHLQPSKPLHRLPAALVLSRTPELGPVRNLVHQQLAPNTFFHEQTLEQRRLYEMEVQQKAWESRLSNYPNADWSSAVHQTHT